MKTMILLVLLISSAFVHRLSAQTSKPLRFLLEGALELGGDEVATVQFTNGQSQRVNAGQGISIGAGGEFAVPGLESLRLRSSVGIKYVTSAADNVHIRLTRIPIRVSGNYVFNETWRTGVGMAFHQNIRFNSGGLGGNFSLGNASGPFFEFAYKSIGLSYTIMSYQDEMANVYAANAIGLIISGSFPRRR
ncbi:MAG: hypothetical protein JJU34_19015 [Lunatimonas sp.]|uniref:hypothetical protein n=1 Tax=Lunatimonas sp. TaxID=2060141 RepID=UPI00263B87CE|nr:hypothetical protein [Lunatimonas sp.]MCC5939378.1 hypothetical protein [Lunatimonas sp.]